MQYSVSEQTSLIPTIVRPFASSLFPVSEFSIDSLRTLQETAARVLLPFPFKVLMQ